MKQTKTVEQFFPKKVQKHHRLWPFMIFKVNNNKLMSQTCSLCLCLQMVFPFNSMELYL